MYRLSLTGYTVRRPISTIVGLQEPVTPLLWDQGLTLDGSNVLKWGPFDAQVGHVPLLGASSITGASGGLLTDKIRLAEPFVMFISHRNTGVIGSINFSDSDIYGTVSKSTRYIYHPFEETYSGARHDENVGIEPIVAAFGSTGTEVFVKTYGYERVALPITSTRNLADYPGEKSGIGLSNNPDLCEFRLYNDAIMTDSQLDTIMREMLYNLTPVTLNFNVHYRPVGWIAVGSPVIQGNKFAFSNDGSQYIDSLSDLFDNDFTLAIAMQITNDPAATLTISSNYRSAVLTMTEAVFDTSAGPLSAVNPGVGNRIVIVGYGQGKAHFMIDSADDNSITADPSTVAGFDVGTQIGGGHNLYGFRRYSGWLNQEQRQSVIDEMSALYF